MKKQPIIGITCGENFSQKQNAKGEDFALRKYYLQAVAALGGVGIILPTIENSKNNFFCSFAENPTKNIANNQTTIPDYPTGNSIDHYAGYYGHYYGDYYIEETGEESPKLLVDNWSNPNFAHQTLQAYLAIVDGLIFSGGGDIHSSFWQEAPILGGSFGQVDIARDCFELALARLAMQLGKPILGICRGLQLLNVALGGSLYQDLGQAMPNGINHQQYAKADQLWHQVLVNQPDFEKIVGAKQFFVNSFHHQGIKKLGENLAVGAVAADGIIEGVLGTGSSYLLAVQWHPERLFARHQPSCKVFESFLQAAGG